MICYAMRQILNQVWCCSLSCLLRSEVIRKIVKIAFPSRKVVASGSLVCNRGVYYIARNNATAYKSITTFCYKATIEDVSSRNVNRTI